MTPSRLALLLSLAALLTLAACGRGAPAPAAHAADVASQHAPPAATPTIAVPDALATVAPPEPTATTGPKLSASAVRMRLIDALSNAPIPDVEVHLPGYSARAGHDGMVMLPADTVGATMTTDGYDPVALTDQAVRSGQIDVQPDAKSTAERYVHDIATADLAGAWAMLTPQAQAAWGRQETFAQFYKEKVGPAPIATAVVGAPSRARPWTDPVTGALVEGATAVPVDLVVVANGGSVAIEGPPMLLVEGAGGWRVARLGAAGPEGTIIVPRARPVRSIRVPILMYHHVAPTPVRSHFRTEYDFRLAYDLTVTPGSFGQQLDFLAAHGYHPIAARAILNYLFYGVPLPPKPIALTFDDGYLDNYTYALPALVRQRMTATFNVITGFVGQQGPDLQYMSWDDIKALLDGGMDVESHTVDHKDLGTLSDDAAYRELAQSRATLQQQLHVAGDLVTYPSGEPFRSGSRARQQALLRLLPRAGYAGGLLDQRVSDTLQDAQTPYQLPRVRVAGGEPIQAFAASIGAPGP